MTVFCYSLYANMLPNSFWRPWGLGAFWAALLVAPCRCYSIVNSAFQALCWHFKFSLPPGFQSELCISSLAGPRISNPRRGSIVNSAFKTPCWHSKLASRQGSIVCSVFEALAGARNSYPRRGSIANSAFQAHCWHSKFAFPPGFYSEFSISSPLFALEIRIPAVVQY